MERDVERVARDVERAQEAALRTQRDAARVRAASEGLERDAARGGGEDLTGEQWARAKLLASAVEAATEQEAAARQVADAALEASVNAAVLGELSLDGAAAEQLNEAVGVAARAALQVEEVARRVKALVAAVERVAAKKKIVFVVDNLFGDGTVRTTLNPAEDWSRNGAEVVLVTLKSAESDVYPVPEGVRRIALDVAGKGDSLLSMVRHNIMPLVKMRRLLRREAPDVVVASSSIAAIVLAWTRRRDMVAVARADLPHPIMRGYWFWVVVREILRRPSYGLLDAVVAETPEGAEWLRKHTLARRTEVIGNAVSVPMADAGARLEVGEVVAAGRKVLLAVGKLIEQKGFDRLLAAFAQVAGRYEDWQLVILGEGALRGDLEAQLRALGLEGRVCLPGFAGNMADWYRAADVFVLASRFEGMPNVLLEAMAHGCAVVSVDCNTGPRHVIRDGENGLLVAQDDGAALAAGLERLMGDEGLRQRLGEAAVGVCERFSPERIRGQWWSLFGELQEQR